MNIGLAADRRCVAQSLRHWFENRFDRDPRMFGLFEHLFERNYARAPGAEVLGSEVQPRCPLNIIIDVTRRDRLRLAIPVDVLEQHLSRKFLATPADALQVRVADADLVNDAVLAREAHQHLASFALQVACPERGRTETFVLLCILLVADPDMLGIQEAHDGGQHRFAGEIAPLEVLFDPTPEARQRLSEFEQPFVLGAFALFTEQRMVAILLAAASVDPGRLKMTLRIGAEPAVLVSGGKGDGVKPVDLVSLGDALPFGIEISPVSAHPLARNSRFRVAAMSQHDAQRFTRLISAHKRVARGRVPIVPKRRLTYAADFQFQILDPGYRRL